MARFDDLSKRRKQFYYGCFGVWAILVFTLFVFEPIQFSLIVGNSMEPQISHGDILVMSNTIEPHVGDVIIYGHPQIKKPVAHRIVEKTENGYKTKGDNNSSTDNYVVTEENIHGVVLKTYEVPVPDSFLWEIHPYYDKPRDQR